MKTTLGGDRLGSGKKQQISIRHYERSTHDLSYLWRSTMAAGTLVPFMNEVALPGDTFDIDLNTHILTGPTTGPLFGSYKVQCDVFAVPIRLYQGKLHQNMLNIGMNMAEVRLPQILIEGNPLDKTQPLDAQHVNPSALLSYLGIKGIGSMAVPLVQQPPYKLQRYFNAIPLLAYWDIYKQYYANKQEEIGFVIHNDLLENDYATVVSAKLQFRSDDTPLTLTESQTATTPVTVPLQFNAVTLQIEFTSLATIDVDSIYIYWGNQFIKATQIFAYNEIDLNTGTVYFSGFIPQNNTFSIKTGYFYIDDSPEELFNTSPKLRGFQLENIDQMRIKIMEHTGQATALTIGPGQTITELEPYTLLNHMREINGKRFFSLTSSQEGLGLKTYQSDLFNNWISTEWLDGANGVNAVSAVKVDENGEFTIDYLNIQRKVYDMLNRISVSGGTYDDWLDATYDHDRFKSIESPVYCGGLSQELVFQEVVSNAATNLDDEQPLGTLAGRGVLSNKHKGGKCYIKIDEPSIIMGIISLTPRLDYSQGNKWSVNLKTMDDLHKPQLDEIGFQDLVTDKMAFWDTVVENANPNEVFFRSVGKQPAWIDYTSNVNQVYGNFAMENDQMYMVLARRYTPNQLDPEFAPFQFSIRDVTTYIDPAKYNHIFAYGKLDAQNFWVQMSVDITARRKMSARQIPNL